MKRLLPNWSGRFLLFGPALLAMIGCKMEPADLFEAVAPSVVVIWATDTAGEALGQGSGVVLEDSLVITNCHVVDEASHIRASQRKDTVEAVLVARDGDRDLCLLQLKRALGTPASLGTSADLRIGHRVYTVGAPVGMELTIGEGILSGFRVFDSSRYLQTTAPISPGSSGGGLWDAEGNLLGITSFYDEFAQSINFAAPVEWVSQVRVRSKNAQDTSQPIPWLERFSQLSQQGDWASLKEMARRWCLREPGNAWAWYARGVAARNLKESPDTTIKAFHRALQLNERFGEAWELLALTWGDLDSLGLELMHHQRAVSCMPHSASAWFNLGACATNLGEHQVAIKAYRRSLKEGGEQSRVWSRLGLSLARSGRSREARDAIRKSLALDSLDPEGHRIHALILQQSGQMDSAMASWRKVLAYQPQDWMAWHNLGVRQYQLGKWQQAIVSLEEAVRLEPTDDMAWYIVASSQRNRGNLPKAVETLQRALNERDSAAILWRSLGEFALQDRRSQVAWDACHRAIILDPQDPGAWACRSHASLRMGRPAQAIADGRRAVSLDHRRKDAWLSISMSARIQGDAALERMASVRLVGKDRLPFQP
jgi:tetratricopeptide (TPR) repeat protein